MSMLAVPIIAVLALALSFLSIVAILVLSARYKAILGVAQSQSQANELLITSLQSAHEQLQVEYANLAAKHEQSFIENTQVSKQLEHRIKTLQAYVNEQQVALEQLQGEQGEDKFYARAIKLAKKGAELDEIVSECELPRAEAEMLLSVYQRTTRP
ncbi:MAG: DUF2802 domain-containing protein [Colwellia sp.]|nr:DUF2802 domain-containing protein [Colwellia sp.]MCW9081091.1 DUF2802 domain-containing protein [Colwellia sp.]